MHERFPPCPISRPSVPCICFRICLRNNLAHKTPRNTQVSSGMHALTHARTSGNLIPCGRRTFEAKFEGPILGKLKKSQVLKKPGSGTPIFIKLKLYIRASRREKWSTERGPGDFPGSGWGRRRSGGLPSCPRGKSPRAAAGEKREEQFPAM